jgi:predicted metal-dependent HD superfamily phosphohydrolase
MPKIVIHNVETNEVIEREMNEQELAVWEADNASIAAKRKNEENAAAAKADLLEKLGITAEEARLLLS